MSGRLGYLSDLWILAVIYNRHHHRSHHRSDRGPRSRSTSRNLMTSSGRQLRRQFHLFRDSESQSPVPRDMIIVHDKRHAHDQGPDYASYKRSNRGAEQPLLILSETVPKLGQVLPSRLERFGQVEQDPHVDIPGNL
jgi:hypothetical protein